MSPLGHAGLRQHKQTGGVAHSSSQTRGSRSAGLPVSQVVEGMGRSLRGRHRLDPADRVLLGLVLACLENREGSACVRTPLGVDSPSRAEPLGRDPLERGGLTGTGSEWDARPEGACGGTPVRARGERSAADLSLLRRVVRRDRPATAGHAGARQERGGGKQDRGGEPPADVGKVVLSSGPKTARPR